MKKDLFKKKNIYIIFNILLLLLLFIYFLFIFFIIIIFFNVLFRDELNLKTFFQNY